MHAINMLQYIILLIQNYTNTKLYTAYTILYHTGNAAFREGQFPQAVVEYEEAILRDPTNAAYYNNLAATLLKLG